MIDLKIDPARDFPLAQEFWAQPIGRHSPNLQRLMRVMRSEPAREKPCLMVIEPGRKWELVQVSGPPENPVLSLGQTFTSYLDAERAVFAMRWKKLTGTDLESLLNEGQDAS